MVKTLRITSIIVAFTAVGLFIVLVFFGVRKVPQIEEFLKAPDAIAKFTTGKGPGSARDESQVSPLVKQATDFARYLNPPPPPPPPRAPGTAATAQNQPAPMTAVSAKFDLIGTSFYAANPEKSLALIDEPGKGLNWVKQGSSVGRLVIERIEDGIITIKDGTRTFQMTVEVEESWRNLLKNPPPASRSGKSVSGSALGQEKPAADITAPVVVGRTTRDSIASRRGLSRTTTRAQPSQAQRNQRDNAETLNSEQKPPTTPKIDSQQKLEEPQTVVEAEGSETSIIQELVSELNSPRITDSEADRLKQLIDALQQPEDSSVNTTEPQPPQELQESEPNGISDVNQ